jgi:hypothetical protein
MSSDNNLTQESSSQERPQAPVSLKTWHRPVISRIEIAHATLGPGGPVGECDGGAAS